MYSKLVSTMLLFIFIVLHTATANAAGIEQGNISYADGVITVTQEPGTNANLYIVKYDGKIMREFITAGVSIGTSGKARFYTELETGDKIMMWSSGMKPLARAYTVTPASPSPTEEPESVGYTLDHEDVTDITEIWQTSYPAALKLVSGAEPYGKYMSFDFRGQEVNSKPAELPLSFDTGGLNYYVTEFDAALSAGNEMPTTLAIKTSGFKYTANQAAFGAGEGYLFKMETAGGSDTWTLNDSDTTVTLSPYVWYHYKIIVNANDATVDVTITDGKGKAAASGIVLPINGAQTDIAGVYMLAGRKYAAISFDNLTVRRRRISDIIY